MWVRVPPSAPIIYGNILIYKDKSADQYQLGTHLGAQVDGARPKKDGLVKAAKKRGRPHGATSGVRLINHQWRMVFACWQALCELGISAKKADYLAIWIFRNTDMKKMFRAERLPDGEIRLLICPAFPDEYTLEPRVELHSPLCDFHPDTVKRQLRRMRAKTWPPADFEWLTHAIADWMTLFALRDQGAQELARQKILQMAGDAFIPAWPVNGIFGNSELK